MVEKTASCILPRLSQWLNALAHADGMEERAEVYLASSQLSGKEGPVSLVLLLEDKRALRRELLQRIMKVRGEIEGVLKSAAKLVINPERGRLKAKMRILELQ